MPSLVFRVYSKLGRLIFTFFHKGRFNSLGQSAHLYSPFRLDGAENIDIGPGTVFQRGSWLYAVAITSNPVRLSVGKASFFGYNNHITAVREVQIGDEVLTANNVYISDNLHGYEDIHTPILRQPVLVKKSVSIGDGSWIGENACIIGASVGRNCVIGANAVVTSDIPDYSVAVGAPAVVIKQYDHTTQQWRKVANASSCQQKNVTE